MRAPTPVSPLSCHHAPPCHTHLASGQILFTSQCACHPEPTHLTSGAAGTRTPDLRRARAALSQLSYGPTPQAHTPGLPDLRPKMVGAPGLEPGTSALSGPRSNQLSYAPDHALPYATEPLCLTSQHICWFPVVPNTKQTHPHVPGSPACALSRCHSTTRERPCRTAIACATTHHPGTGAPHLPLQRSTA